MLRAHRIVVIALLTLGATTGCASAGGVPTSTDVAEVARPTSVFAQACVAKRIGRLRPDAEWGTSRTAVRVLERRELPTEPGAPSRYCLKVVLPTRSPSRGWVTSDNLVLRATPRYVRVDRSARRIDVFESGRLRWRWPAVVGAPATPTPLGVFAVQGVNWRMSGDIGGVATGVAYSEVLDQFAGGPGRVAIHGRGGALLADPLGSARSHGCIRLDTNNARRLGRYLRNGDPVDIVA